MTSYIQTTAAPPVHQERLNLNWLLPLSYREEHVAVEQPRESNNNGAKWSSDLLSLSSTNGCTSDDCKAVVKIKKPKSSDAKNDDSLDMCTETLGCENGTMYSAEDYRRDGLLCERALGFPTSQEEAEARRMAERRIIIKKVRSRTSNSESPPPPPVLTTRRTGENFLSIVRERANGRMVMYAVRHQSTVTAERSDGRLTLRLLSSAGCSDHDDTSSEEIQDDHEDEREGEDYLGVVGKEMNGGGGGGGEGTEAEGKKYVFVGRCYKEEEKRGGGWTPLMVASAI